MSSAAASASTRPPGHRLAKSPRRGRSARSGLPVVVVVIAVATVLVGLLAVGLAIIRPEGSAGAGPPGPAPTGRRAAIARPAATAPGVQGAPERPWPRAVLARWDARRAEAWANGDVAGLRRLYATRSLAGRADVAMLRRWRARDLRVRGMREQLSALRVLRAGPHLLRLQITDRVVDARAVDRRGHSRALPADRPTTRVLVLHRGGSGPWLMRTVS